MEDIIPRDTKLIKPRELRQDKNSLTETITAGELFDRAGCEYVCILNSGPSFCAPCRRAEPMLAQRAKQIGARALFLFVSHEQDQDTFDEFYAKMDFAAVPFDSNIRTQLHRFADGVPTATIVQIKTGAIINDDAVGDLGNDSTGGAGFPYKKPTVEEALADLVLTNKDGTKKATWAELASGHQYMALLFSASWCPPCRQFGPVVNACANQTAAADAKKCAFVLVGGDREQDKFTAYSHHYDVFWSVPFGHPAHAALSKKYQVSGIPSFITIQPTTLEPINLKARSAVMSNPGGCPWIPAPPPLVVDFARTEECVEAFADRARGNSAVLLNLANAPDDAAAADASARFTAAAEAYKKSTPEGTLRFLVLKRGGDEDLWEQLSSDVGFDADSVKGSKGYIVKFNLFQSESATMAPINWDALPAFLA
jgi:thiol-disulfide isomerase/thioredoxin